LVMVGWSTKAPSVFCIWIPHFSVYLDFCPFALHSLVTLKGLCFNCSAWNIMCVLWCLVEYWPVQHVACHFSL
jgi:hypothetical protein